MGANVSSLSEVGIRRYVTFPVALAMVCLAVVAGVLLYRMLASPADQGTPAADSYRPHLADYDRVPLPAHRPPSGALVNASNYADASLSGQHIAFDYNGFTISACTRFVGVSELDSCKPQADVTVFRRIATAKTVTTYAVSAKDPTKVRSRIVDFFRTTDVTIRPPWMSAYAESSIKKVFGPS